MRTRSTLQQVDVTGVRRSKGGTAPLPADGGRLVREIGKTAPSRSRLVRRRLAGRSRVGGIATLTLALLCTLAMIGCEGREATDDKLRVAVSIPPLLSLVSELLPEGAEAILLMPPGASPHTYEPKPGDIAALAGADLLLVNGLGLDIVFEDAARSLGGRGPKLVRLSDLAGIEADLSNAHSHHDPHDCDHHDCDHHHHGDLDPHLWLDPLLMRDAANALRQALLDVVTDPGQREQISERSQTLIERFESLHEKYEKALAPLRGAGFIAEHLAYGRLASRYDVRQVGTMRRVAQVEPTPAVVQDLVRLIQSGEARAIFVEPQFPGDAARRLAELTGAPVHTLDPLGEGDWFAMMEANLEALANGLTPTKP